MDSRDKVGLAVVFLLPLVLTSAGMMAAYVVNLNVITQNKTGPFLVYGLANWVTLAVLAVIVRSTGKRFRQLGFGRSKGKHFVASFLFFIVGVALFWLLEVLLPGLALKGMDYQLEGLPAWLIIIFSPVVTSPICEEVFYRGYAITVLGDRLGNYWLGGLVSCAVFALLHLPYFGVMGVIAITIWSLLPMVLFVWSRNIYPGMLMHFLNNLFAYVVLKLVLGQVS